MVKPAIPKRTKTMPTERYYLLDGLALFTFITLGFLPAHAGVPEEIHKRCIDAKDYTGCVNAQNSTSGEKSATVTGDPFWFDVNSVKQLRARGEYGRYLTFNGRTVFNAYDYGWSSGTFSGNALSENNSTSISGVRSGLSVSGTTRTGAFTYHLDCKEGTADRLGDSAYAQEDTAGWFPVVKDPTAQAVYTKYCKSISELPLGGDI